MTDTNAKIVEPLNDVEYLELEAKFLVAKAARAEAERGQAEGKTQTRRDTIGVKPTTASKDMERRIAALRDAEDQLRHQIDQRVAVTTATGKTLGIDALVTEFKLNAVERTAILLSTLVCLGQKYEDAINRVAEPAFSRSLSPQGLWSYLGLGFAERIAARACFQPTSPLLKHGLVTLTMGHSATPYELRECDIGITQMAFDRVLGLPATGKKADTGDQN